MHLYMRVSVGAAVSALPVAAGHAPYCSLGGSEAFGEHGEETEVRGNTKSWHMSPSETQAFAIISACALPVLLTTPMNEPNSFPAVRYTPAKPSESRPLKRTVSRCRPRNLGCLKATNVVTSRRQTDTSFRPVGLCTAAVHRVPSRDWRGIAEERAPMPPVLYMHILRSWSAVGVADTSVQLVCTAISPVLQCLASPPPPIAHRERTIEVTIAPVRW
mmetsp:Transcript_39114/g.76459  ORF Transcript_39114/g.76459 Transcript_39114/m.76459 type:complete len:217 (+) Transcript_39114:862-1512(+)